jgi:light-harvesting complex I chlorophyll a/b binding protein 1
MECPAKLDGSMVGDVGFDPMCISDTLPDLQWARTAEIKHGRIAQLATVGFLWQEAFGAQVIRAVPGYGDFDCRDPIGAIGKVPLAASVQVFLAIAIVELATIKNTYGDAIGHVPL